MTVSKIEVGKRYRIEGQSTIRAPKYVGTKFVIFDDAENGETSMSIDLALRCWEETPDFFEVGKSYNYKKNNGDAYRVVDVDKGVDGQPFAGAKRYNGFGVRYYSQLDSFDFEQMVEV